MKNQRKVERARGKGQEGKRFSGRFSILMLVNNADRKTIFLEQKKPAGCGKPSHIHVVEPK